MYTPSHSEILHNYIAIISIYYCPSLILCLFRYLKKECDQMNAEFVKALLGAGNEIHAVGLVVNIQERSGLQIQLMIGLLHELKVDLKHILVVFTHGDSILPTPPPTDLRKRCEKRYQLVPQHITGLDCLQSLVANVERRYLVVESLQLSERDIIVELLFEHIESMAAHPMTNDIFLNSLQWWNEQQGNRERKERELKEAKDKLAKLRSEQAKTDVRKLRSKLRYLKDECSDLSSKLDKISEMKKILEDVHQVESDMTKCIADSVAVNMELRTVNKEESVLHEQQSTLKKIECMVMQNFEDKARIYTDTCRDVISHRDEGIAILWKAADEVDALKKATRANVTGFSAGIAGGAIFTIGAGLMLASGGISAPAAIPLLAIGGVVGAAGSVTAIRRTVRKIVKKKRIIKKTKPWLAGNKNRCTNLIRIHADLTEEQNHIDELFPNLAKFPKRAKQVDERVSVWSEIIQHSAENAALVVLLAASSGLGIAQGDLEGIECTAELAALGVKAGAKAAGGVVVGLSGLVILLDMGLLIKSGYKLDKVVRKGMRTKTAQALIDLAEAVRKENNSLREAILGTTSEPTDDPTASVISNPSVGNGEQLQDSPIDDLEPNPSNQGESHSASGAHTSSARVDEINHYGDDASVVSLRTEEVGEGPSVYILPQYTDSSDTSEDSVQEDDRTQLHSASDHSLSDSLSIVPINDVPEADTSDTGNRYSCIIS